MTTTNKPAAAPAFLKVPAGTKPTRCRGQTCGKLIYFVRSSGGRLTPVDCDVEGGKRPSETRDKGQGDIFDGTVAVYDGRGVSHFATCPEAGMFRRRDD